MDFRLSATAMCSFLLITQFYSPYGDVLLTQYAHDNTREAQSVHEQRNTGQPA